MQCKTTLVMAVLLLCLSACGGPNHDRRLYTTGSSPQLRDSEIVIETFSPMRTAKVIETRRIRCTAGKIHANIAKLRRRGAADLSDALYGEIWGRLLSKDVFALKVEAAAADGGLYHLVRLRLGGRQTTFSAQRKANFFGFASSSMQERMDLLNAVVRLLSQEVTTVPVTPEATAPTK